MQSMFMLQCTGALTILQAGEGAFANIVTVRSNLDDAGVHQVTHRVKNLRNGASTMLLNNTVNAQKVITKFTSQS